MVDAKEAYRYSIKARLRDYKGKADYETNAPMLESTLYKTKDKTLVFIGGLHIWRFSEDKRRVFLNFLKSVIKSTRPGFILVEVDKVVTRKQIIKKLYAPKNVWTEVEWIAYLANKNNIKIGGMDDQEPNINFDDNELKCAVLMYVLRRYNSKYTKGRNLTDSDHYKLAINNFISDLLVRDVGGLKKRVLLMDKGNAQLHELIKRINQDAINMYVAKRPIGLLLEELSRTGPYPFSKEYKYNRFLAIIESYRNKSMIEECINKMKKYDVVVALAGVGHIQTIRNLLKKEIETNFGSTKMFSWADYSHKMSA